MDTGEEVWRRSIWRPPDQGRWAPVRRPEISFSHGAEWNALISMYIQTIPLSGDACCAAAQSTSGGPPKNARQERHDCESRRGCEGKPTARDCRQPLLTRGDLTVD